MIAKICRYCGKTYFVPNSQGDRSKFCCDECFRASRNHREDYTCDYCGKIFKAKQNDLKKLKTGERKNLFCSRECANNFQKPKWEDIVSLFKERGYELISTEYKKAKIPLEYVCPRHRDKGIQKITYGNLKAGFGCKYCGQERTADSMRGTFEHAKEVFLKHDMVLIDQPYINEQTPMKYICIHHPECGIQEKTLANAYKQGCPYCRKSHGQTAIADYLVRNNITFESPKKFNDLNVGTTKRSLLSYDFYVPSYNLLIEFQGIQHYLPVERFGGEEQFKVQQEHDNLKRTYAHENGYDLLEIKYTDIKKVDQILSQKLL